MFLSIYRDYRKMYYLFILSLAFCCRSSMSIVEIFWKDEKLGAYVVDGVFSSKSLQRFHSFFAGGDYPMTFNGDSKEYASNFSVLSGFKTKYNLARNSKSVISLAKSVGKLYPKLGEVHASHTDGIIIERSDFNPTATACVDKESKVLGIVMLNAQWKKNDYGEVGLLDDNEEILMSFHPKPGRIILMKCGTKISSIVTSNRKTFAFCFYRIWNEQRESKKPN